jgi:hypothetical protein
MSFAAVDALTPLRRLALMHATELNRCWRDALPLSLGIHFSRACPFPALPGPSSRHTGLI